MSFRFNPAEKRATHLTFSPINHIQIDKDNDTIQNYWLIFQASSETQDSTGEGRVWTFQPESPKLVALMVIYN